jgi:hypothetical protein
LVSVSLRFRCDQRLRDSLSNQIVKKDWLVCLRLFKQFGILSGQVLKDSGVAARSRLRDLHADVGQPRYARGKEPLCLNLRKGSQLKLIARGFADGAKSSMSSSARDNLDTRNLSRNGHAL